MRSDYWDLPYSVRMAIRKGASDASKARRSAGAVAAKNDEIEALAQSNRRLREVLYVIAPHHQGGHSETGKMIAAALGCDFPLDMDRLKARAEADGLNPDVLWPWLAKTNAIRDAALKDNGHAENGR